MKNYLLIMLFLLSLSLITSTSAATGSSASSTSSGSCGMIDMSFSDVDYEITCNTACQYLQDGQTTDVFDVCDTLEDYGYLSGASNCSACRSTRSTSGSSLDDYVNGTRVTGGDASNAHLGAAVVTLSNEQATIQGYSDDTDYYLFVATSTGTATITLSGLSDSIYTRFYNSSLSTALGNTSADNSLDKTISYDVVSGSRYYIVAGPYSSGQKSHYSLSIGISTSGSSSTVSNPISASDDYVNGIKVSGGDASEYASGAASVTLSSGQATVQGYSSDDDYYSFVASGTGTATITLSGLSDSVYTRLKSSSDTLLKDTSADNSQDKTITYDVTSGSKYYIVVDPYGSSKSDYTLSIDIPTGGSSATVSGSDDYVNGTRVSGGDAGEDYTNAASVTLSSGLATIQGYCEGNDYYSFVATDTSTATITLSGLSDNIFTILYDSKGQIVAHTGVEGSLDKTITYDVASGSTYFVGVHGYYTTSKSDYALSISLSSITTGSTGTATPPLETVEIPSVTIGNIAYEMVNICFDEVNKTFTTKAPVTSSSLPSLGLSLGSTGISNNSCSNQNLGSYSHLSIKDNNLNGSYVDIYKSLNLLDQPVAFKTDLLKARKGYTEYADTSLKMDKYIYPEQSNRVANFISNGYLSSFTNPYFYYVRSCLQSRECSDFTVIQDGKDMVPTGVVARAVDSSNNTIVLDTSSSLSISKDNTGDYTTFAWNPIPNYKDIATYTVYRATSGDGGVDGAKIKVAEGISDLYFIDTSVTQNNYYRYYVSATFPNGAQSQLSATVSAVWIGPIPGTIAAPVLSLKIVNNGSDLLTWTSVPGTDYYLHIKTGSYYLTDIGDNKLYKYEKKTTLTGTSINASYASNMYAGTLRNNVYACTNYPKSCSPASNTVNTVYSGSTTGGSTTNPPATTTVTTPSTPTSVSAKISNEGMKNISGKLWQAAVIRFNISAGATYYEIARGPSEWVIEKTLTTNGYSAYENLVPANATSSIGGSDPVQVNTPRTYWYFVKACKKNYSGADKCSSWSGGVQLQGYFN